MREYGEGAGVAAEAGAGEGVGLGQEQVLGDGGVLEEGGLPSPVLLLVDGLGNAEQLLVLAGDDLGLGEARVVDHHLELLHLLALFVTHE